MVVKKVPRWESELWSYVSSGDGEHCPLESQCKVKQECGWCISEHREHLNRLLDTSHFDYRNYDFLDFVKPGRIFVLIEKLAQKYLKMGNVHSPPVPAVLIALCDKRCAVEVREIPLKSYQGAIWHLRDRWVVHLNADAPSSRKRFSLFHEAFHILAHCKATPVFRKRGIDRGAFNELLAEYFATCILIPREWVKEKWVEVHDLNRMAEIFDVPETAMCIRLRLLDLV